jgi:hypothetical protein
MKTQNQKSIGVNAMEDTVEIMAEKVLNSLSGYSPADQAVMLVKIAERLMRYEIDMSLPF